MKNSPETVPQKEEWAPISPYYSLISSEVPFVEFPQATSFLFFTFPATICLVLRGTPHSVRATATHWEPNAFWSHCSECPELPCSTCGLEEFPFTESTKHLYRSMTQQLTSNSQCMLCFHHVLVKFNTRQRFLHTLFPFCFHFHGYLCLCRNQMCSLQAGGCWCFIGQVPTYYLPIFSSF